MKEFLAAAVFCYSAWMAPAQAAEPTKIIEKRGVIDLEGELRLQAVLLEDGRLILGLIKADDTNLGADAVKAQATRIKSPGQNLHLFTDLLVAQHSNMMFAITQSGHVVEVSAEKLNSSLTGKFQSILSKTSFAGFAGSVILLASGMVIPTDMAVPATTFFMGCLTGCIASALGIQPVCERVAKYKLIGQEQGFHVTEVNREDVLATKLRSKTGEERSLGDLILERPGGFNRINE